MKRIMFFLSLFAVLAVNEMDAFIFTQAIDEEELRFKVKQIDEFFSRFNFETDYKGEPFAARTDSVAEDSVLKRRNLAMLLDFDTFAKGNVPDSAAVEFVNYVVDNNKQIHYGDTTWFAEVVGTCLINGKTNSIRLSLRTENVKDVIYKWVISDVDIPQFSCLTDSVRRNVSIMPGAHGSSFITLPQTVNLNAESVRTLFRKGYKPEPLTLFAYFVSTGQMKLGNVTKVIYHFDIGDYEFTVERFEKGNSYNNGWLISSITKKQHP